MLGDYSSENPIFVDFETQSACDITLGGRAYATHESTRILILVVCKDDLFHVWIPDDIRVDTTNWNAPRLWPYQLKPKQPIQLYRGKDCPKAIVDAVKGHPLVAHNAYGFDQLIWDRFIGEHKPGWIDTLYLARMSNRPGKLDTLSKQLLGQGKDRAKKLLPILTTAKPSVHFGGYSYPVIQPGDLQAFTTYAIADVEILRQLYKEFDSVKVEIDVIETHLRVNERGIKLDCKLLNIVKELSQYSVYRATDEIKKLTNNKLHEHNLRSTKQVHAWLDSYGVTITDDSPEKKPSLRKEIVQRVIDSPYIIEDNLEASREIPPVVVDVLKLRMKALRITEGKLSAAMDRLGPKGRLYDVHAYSAAGTGRFSSYGLQIHNLPRPLTGMKKGFVEDVLALIHSHKGTTEKLFDSIKEFIEVYKENPKSYVSVDDVCSTLIRPTIIPAKGHVFIPCDYSAVEARGVAWIADESKLLEIFNAHGDPYKVFASRCYNIPVEEVTSDMRQGVGKVGILGLGYGMGATKARIFAANAGVDLAKVGLTGEELVNIYRNEYKAIAGFQPNKRQNFRTGGIWHKLDKAVKDCVSKYEESTIGKCYFRMDGNTLKITLPSGRELWYPNARIADIIPPYCYTMNLPLVPKATVVYDSNRGLKSLYGGIITENIVQALCRDFLVTAMIDLDHMGLNPVLHVHDEIVCEVPIKQSDRALRKIVETMSTLPAWAEGFPLSCEGFITPRFVKKPFRGYHELTTKDLYNVRQA